jgi:hypothetical protein
MSAGTESGLVGAIRIDVKRLHETWMEIIYPRQLDADQTVLGKWQPETQAQQVTYTAWAAIGMPIVAILYPLVVLGYLARFQTRRLDSAVTRIGLLGVVVLSIIVWGGLSALARFQLTLSAGGFLAVVAAGVVATVAAALAYVTQDVGGRKTTVLIAYPLAMTAIFLPPVVAALYSQTVAAVVFPKSTSLAKWLLDNVLTIGGINTYLRQQYDLRGLAYVGMWFAIAVPVGWLLGSLVSLADYVRPS